MIREKKEKPNQPIVIDLTGPEGNAFVLMSYATRFAKQLELDSSKILEEMRSSDYENLLQVFNSYFGEWVILKR